MPGLVGADRLAVVAEVFLVVEVDGGEHGDVGVDDVDRVQAPPSPTSEDREVEVASAKIASAASVPNSK
jgi:hypothetical protein